MFRQSLESKGHELRNVIEALFCLCNQDASIETAFLCKPATLYIAKKHGQGQLCGYRNIQMLISYMSCFEARQQYEAFGSKIPSVLELQDLIERAWDVGINPEGRIETGGIKGTEKYIGTSEAQALFKSLDIPCKANAHPRTIDASSAFSSLLSSVEQYFRTEAHSATGKVHQTSLPPVFLQRPGHSYTIVGFEKRRNGSTNLLVFDPSFDLVYLLRRLLASASRGRKPRFVASKLLLAPFRRGKGALRRYKAFETLSLGEIAC